MINGKKKQKLKRELNGHSRDSTMVSETFQLLPMMARVL